MRVRREIKLGFIAKKILLRKGKNDAKKKVIQNLGYNKTPISPYFDEETAVCIANIHKEYEKFLNYKTKITNKIIKNDNRINKFASHIFMLDNETTHSKTVLDELNKIVFEEVDNNTLKSERLIGESIILNDDELLSDDMLKEFRFIEKKAAVESEKYKVNIKKESIERKIGEYTDKTFKLKKQMSDVETLNKREREKLLHRFGIFISRCNQHYELTAARISAYWNGAKYSFNESEIADFNSSIILLRIEEKIILYKKLGDDIKC